jgi:hypothetical protein
MIVANIGIAQRKVEATNIEPSAFGLMFLKPFKRKLGHATAITLRIAAGTDDEMTWHRRTLARSGKLPTQRAAAASSFDKCLRPTLQRRGLLFWRRIEFLQRFRHFRF